MKKLFAIILALALIIAMSATAFADNETYTLTITGAKGHSYAIYQIFTGDVSEEGGKTVLSNVRYGENCYPEGEKGGLVPTQVLETVVNAQDPANLLNTTLRNDPIVITAVAGDDPLVIEGLVPGYYLIKDVTADLPDGQTKSPIMLQVLENVTIASKHASIVSEKKVDDKNDSTTDEDDVNWQDAADYDIGDAVPFQLSVTLPSTLNVYDSYEVTFHDKQADGFDAPVISSVYILKADGTTKIEITAAADGASGYSLQACTNPNCEYGGCSFTIHVGDIKALYGVNTFADGDKLVVEYTSVLNSNANIGEAGNENSMYVCHPDGHTPKDAVTVLTYALNVNKIDGTSKEALEGAGFTLYKWNAEANDWVAVGTEITGVTTFTWSGIDGGKYKLVESTTPTGYNTIADVEFVLNATHKTTWLADGNTAFEDVIAKTVDGTAVVFADRNADGIEDGKLEGNIENYKGTILPETGAEGTFFLITAGSLLVMVAVVFMITRKKMSVYED